MNTDGLTREQMLELKPGRELNALVMRTVFKAEKKDIDDECYWVSEVKGEEVCWPRWFSPSTDIAAAWEIEEKAMDIDSMNYIAALMEVVWKDEEGVDYMEIIDPANTIEWSSLPQLIHATPEQRCKAALLAVRDVMNRWHE